MRAILLGQMWPVLLLSQQYRLQVLEMLLFHIDEMSELSVYITKNISKTPWG